MAPYVEGIMEMENERAAATAAIVESTADKKLIVAGPGTGKTFAFRQALQASGGRGLALTFIRNLVADLKTELADVADVFTFHGFCKHLMHRHLVEGLREGWDYYPVLLDLIAHDLEVLGLSETTKREIEASLHELDDSDGVISNVLDLGNYYNAVSHTDLVYRVLRHFEHNEASIPEYPLIVVDEYQDFSRLETSFIRLLETNSRTLVAGDDDQALYGFKNASARFLRELAEAGDHARFELPYCSRCTQVIVDAVNDLIEAAVENGHLEGRIEKEFRCYLPDKQTDSESHPRIVHARCTVERKNAPYIGRYVADQIAAIPAEDIRESHESGYTTALVIGPNPFLKRAYDLIRTRFPQAELKVSEQPVVELLDAYLRLAADENSRLGWRILLHSDPVDNAAEILVEVLSEQNALVEELPADYRERHLAIAALLKRLLEHEQLDQREEAAVVEAVDKSIEEIEEVAILRDDVEEHDDGEQPGVDEECAEPSIICTSLVGAKGLAAGYVYIVGFNDGHLPRDPNAITDDEVCRFLVGLSRTRKECHLVSCRRLGNQTLPVSTFANWVRTRLDEVVVNAAYFAS